MVGRVQRQRLHFPSCSETLRPVSRDGGQSCLVPPSEGEVDLSLFARTDTPRLADSNFIQDGNSELKPNFPRTEEK